MKNILIYTSLLALISLEAQALTVHNFQNRMEFYFDFIPNDGEQFEASLGTATPNHTTYFNATPHLGDLIQHDLPKGGKGTIQFKIRNSGSTAPGIECGDPQLVRKDKAKEDLHRINNLAFDYSGVRGCVETSSNVNIRKK